MLQNLTNNTSEFHQKAINIRSHINFQPAGDMVGAKCTSQSIENLFRVVFTAYSSKYTTKPRNGVKVNPQSTNGVPSSPATLILYMETGETIAVVFYCTKWDSTSLLTSFHLLL